jgi:hypothetical protein
MDQPQSQVPQFEDIQFSTAMVDIASIESTMDQSFSMITAMDYSMYADEKEADRCKRSPESSLTDFFNDPEFTQPCQKKSVVFRTDESGEIVQDVLVYDQEGSREELYYSGSQILSFKLRAKQCGKAIRDRYRGEVAQLETLYIIEQRDIRIAKLWAKSYARGLEEHVSEKIRYERRKHLSSFLSYQSLLIQEHFDKTEKDELLRAHRRESTRQARYFAARIAAGDALAAR